LGPNYLQQIGNCAADLACRAHAASPACPPILTPTTPPPDLWSSCRVVVEKPFGRNGAEARALSASLAAHIAEAETFRIDHYLAKASASLPQQPPSPDMRTQIQSRMPPSD